MKDVSHQNVKCDIELKAPSDKVKKSVNIQRVARFTTYGFFVSGTSMHFVYSKILPKIAPGCSMGAVVKKVLFTQTIFNIVGTYLFYSILTLLEGRGFEAAIREC